MRYRQVNLDFHTSELIDGIGSGFDPEKFKDALKTGHIDSVTLFAKCHHGWSYHPTAANEMHPHLDFDLLGAQIKAAHEIGVKTPVYISAGLDEKEARRHPEWLVRAEDESTTWAKDFTEPGYHRLCMASGYIGKLEKQVEEVCKNYDADGIFLDIAGVIPCYCQNCVREREEAGEDPYDEAAVMRHAEEVYRRYALRMRKAVDRCKPGLPLFHNGGHIRHGRRDLAHCNTHLEIESLPTGGWGYDHFPFSAAYCRTLGMEYTGMTGKFHSTWGEFGGFKHPNALRYEVSLAAAMGAGSSVGDQLSPDGVPDKVTYEMIGKAYSELEKKEPWLRGAENIADIAVLSPEACGGEFSTAQTSQVGAAGSGVVRMLLEGKYLFDITDTEADLDGYKAVILADVPVRDSGFEKKLAEFTRRGGKVLATGHAIYGADGAAFLDLGAVPEGQAPYSPDYFRPCADIGGMGDTGYIMYGSGIKIGCTGTELGRREEPYFNRTRAHFCGHRHAPDSGRYGGAGMTEGKDGIYIAWDIFTDYAENGSLSCRHMVCFALDRLLGDEITLKTDLQSQGIVTLTEQQDRYICHLLYASPVKRGKDTEVIEDIVPIYGTELSIKTGHKPGRVYLAPQNTELPFIYENGRVKVTIDSFECHQMVVTEK